MMDDEILSGLLKRAKGYSYKEVQEEYSVKEDGEIALTKRKVTKKYCPPDSGAIKTYIELSSDRDIADYSDEELESERIRLLGLLEKEGGKAQKTVKKAVSAVDRKKQTIRKSTVVSDTTENNKGEQNV